MKRFAIIFSVLIMFFACSVFADEVTVAWDAAEDSYNAGLPVYVCARTEGEQFDSEHPVAVANSGANEVLIENLVAGTTYYFAAYRYDPNYNGEGNGAWSGFSEEVSFLAQGEHPAPVVVPLPKIPTPSSPANTTAS